MLAGGGGVVDASAVEVADVRMELLMLDDELVLVGDDGGDLVDVGDVVFGDAVVGDADLDLSSSSFSSSSRRCRLGRRPLLLKINGCSPSARRLPAPVPS